MLNLSPVSVKNPKLCPIDPKNRVWFGEFVTIRKGDIYLSDSLWQKMDYPDFIQIAMDEKEKIFGLKKTDDKDPFKLAVRMNETGGARAGGTTNVAHTITTIMPFEVDLDLENITFSHGFKAGEYFCFSVDYAEKRNINRRKRKNEQAM